MSQPRISAEPLLAAGFVVMWSSGFIGAELAEGLAAPTTLLAWRFITMTAALAAWLLWRRRTVRPRDLALHAVIGALTQAGFLYGVFAAAANGVSSGTSALIAALQPIVATAAAAPLLGESITARQVAGLALGLGGVALVVGADLGGDGHTPLWAFALPLAAMLSLVTGTLVERRTRPRAGLPEALAVQCAISALLFTGLGAATDTLAPPADPMFWTAVAWVVVLSGAGGYGFYWANVARSGVGRVSGLLYLTPPATMVWAWAMLDDTITTASLAGLGVCAAAVLLVRAGTTPTPAPRLTPADADPLILDDELADGAAADREHTAAPQARRHYPQLEGKTTRHG